MKKKKTIIMITILLIIVGCIAGLYIVPNFRPIAVRDFRNGVYYLVGKDHAEVVWGTSWYETKNQKWHDWGLGYRRNVKIKDKVLGRPVTCISYGCFEHDSSIENIIIPDTVTAIYKNAFFKCTNLKNVSMGENVEYIGNKAFCGCESLENIELNEGLECIDAYAFVECKKLKSIIIPASVNIVERSAFSRSGLEEVTFAGTVENIGANAFYRTPWLKKQGDYVIHNDILLKYQGASPVSVIPEGVRIISGAYDRDDMTDIYLPASLEKIMAWSFEKEAEGEAAVRIYIPAEVQNIEFENEHAMFDIMNTTIVTTKGSYAEKLAKEYGMACEIVDEIIYPK